MKKLLLIILIFINVNIFAQSRDDINTLKYFSNIIVIELNGYMAWEDIEGNSVFLNYVINDIYNVYDVIYTLNKKVNSYSDISFIEGFVENINEVDNTIYYTAVLYYKKIYTTIIYYPSKNGLSFMINFPTYY